MADQPIEFDADDYDEYPFVPCPICGADTESEQCWQCQGEGGFHDCGEDCCICLDKEEITEQCTECEGRGFYFICTRLPHTEEQVAAWREKERIAKTQEKFQ
jgi:hypothetical protein